MKYEEWRKLMVSTSDIRTLNIDGFQCNVDEPIPGVAFMLPVFEDFRGHPNIKRFDCLGFITHDSKRGMWDVQIENTEKEFIGLVDAINYLWNTHYKDELDPGPAYLLIGVDVDGKITTNRICASWRDLVRVVEQELPDPEYSKRALEDLSKVGSRYFEFSYGHFAAFPLEQ